MAASVALDGVLAGGLHGRSECPGLWAFRRHLKEEGILPRGLLLDQRTKVTLEDRI